MACIKNGKLFNFLDQKYIESVDPTVIPVQIVNNLVRMSNGKMCALDLEKTKLEYLDITGTSDYIVSNIYINGDNIVLKTNHGFYNVLLYGSTAYNNNNRKLHIRFIDKIDITFSIDESANLTSIIYIDEQLLCCTALTDINNVLYVHINGNCVIANYNVMSIIDCGTTKSDTIKITYQTTNKCIMTEQLRWDKITKKIVLNSESSFTYNSTIMLSDNSIERRSNYFIMSGALYSISITNGEYKYRVIECKPYRQNFIKTATTTKLFFVSIQQIYNCYYLLDTTGTIWQLIENEDKILCKTCNASFSQNYDHIVEKN
jgi:hypothetical protein